LYRALTWLLPVPLGVGCWLYWRSNRSWRKALPDDRPSGVDDAEPEPLPADAFG
jgi:hypothetical protein